jgi:amino acid transporter
MIAVFPLIFIVWKLVKKTKWLKPTEVVIRTSEVDEIEAYTANFKPSPSR